MLNVVEDTINRIYRTNDYKFFVTKCNKELELPKELDKYIKEQGYKLIGIFDNQSPSRRWYCYFSDFVKGEFKVLYKTMFEISKIAPLFYIQHEFEVENKDNNKINPVLDGFDSQPYTKEQAGLNDEIVSVLSKYGYKELSSSEMNEVVVDIKIPEDVSVFGTQATVEHLLFNDILDLTSN
ncbi:hypothetical protein UT300007_26960 [Clostridium sp. CTA-7]